MNHAKELGVKIGLGTDVAGGYSPSMLSALRSAVITSKALRMQHLAPTEHGTEPSPANSHLLDYKVSGHTKRLYHCRHIRNRQPPSLGTASEVSAILRGLSHADDKSSI